jgi:hypothetical protein
MHGEPAFAREGHHTGGNSSSVGKGIQGQCDVLETGVNTAHYIQ